MAVKIKEPVRLRQRAMASGRVSLYLDIYFRGRRSYEYLRLYLVPERTAADRESNRRALELAEAVRAKRLIELRNGEYGFGGPSGADTGFAAYFGSLAAEREARGSAATARNWRMCLNHLKAYDRRLGSLRLSDITAEWARGFRSFLSGGGGGRRPLAPGSQSAYFDIFRACVNSAFREGLLRSNPLRAVPGIRKREAVRTYLTVGELKALAGTPCGRDIVRRSFLFSCLTGLRSSDIAKLRWGEAREQGGYTRLVFSQRKTGGLEYLDIAPEAAALMGPRGGDGDLPFAGMPCASAANAVLRRWCAAAGIGKHITFHCGRHTFATMMLSLGADIYTVSRLLGHRDLKTTQIYAKVVDRAKRDAVSRIPSILPGL